MGQRYQVDPRHQDFANGARGWWARGHYPFGDLGPYAKVHRCPVAGRTHLRLTVYATSLPPVEASTAIPACTRYKGVHTRGWIIPGGAGPIFRVHEMHANRFTTQED